MRKRIVSIVFATFLAASLAACGFSSNSSGGVAEDQVIENTANAQDDAKAESGVAALESQASDSSKVESVDSSKAAVTDSSSASKPIKAEEITETPKPTKVPEKPEETKKSIGDYNPDDVKVTFDNVYADQMETGKISAVYKGEEIWSKTTGSYPVSQIDTVSGLGKYDKKYFYIEKGAVVCVDLATGNELWRNNEFGGSPAEKAYAFGNDGTLYVSGYLGPDLFVCKSDGTTVKNIGTFNEEFYWPYELTYSEKENTLKIVFEMSPYGDGGTLYISLPDYTAHDKKAEDDSASKEEDGPIYYPDVENYLSLREGPSTDSTRKKKIYPGTALVVLGYENGMARVRVQDTGETGYVNPDYIKAAGSSGSKDGPIYYPNVKNYLSLREGPSTDSTRKKKIYPGTALVVLGYENGMAKVRVQDTGETGYVNPDYIKAAGSSDKKESSGSSSSSSSDSDLKPGMTAYANVKEYLSLREGPSTSSDVIRKLPDWAELTILEYPQGKMVKVRDEESGLTGYVHIDFLSY